VNRSCRPLPLIGSIIPVVAFIIFSLRWAGRFCRTPFWRTICGDSECPPAIRSRHHRYQTLDVVRAVVERGTLRRLPSIPTGNDDNILIDPVTHSFGGKKSMFSGGLLGHLACGQDMRYRCWHGVNRLTLAQQNYGQRCDLRFRPGLSTRHPGIHTKSCAARSSSPADCALGSITKTSSPSHLSSEENRRVCKPIRTMPQTMDQFIRAPG